MRDCLGQSGGLAYGMGEAWTVSSPPVVAFGKDFLLNGLLSRLLAVSSSSRATRSGAVDSAFAAFTIFVGFGGTGGGATKPLAPPLRGVRKGFSKGVDEGRAAETSMLLLLPCPIRRGTIGLDLSPCFGVGNLSSRVRRIGDGSALSVLIVDTCRLA